MQCQHPWKPPFPSVTEDPPQYYLHRIGQPAAQGDLALPGWRACQGCRNHGEGSFLVLPLHHHSLLVVFLVLETLVLVASFYSCPTWCGHCHLCQRPSEIF